MKIAIIGGGISGCAIYLLLQKHLPPPPSAEQHSITIYEAYSTDKDTTASERAATHTDTHSSTLIVGGGLGVGANGLGVLQRLDEELLKDVTRDGYVVSSMIMKSKSGRVLVQGKAAGEPETDGDRAGMTKSMNMVACSRHLFWRCLRVRVPDEHIVTTRVRQVVARPDGLNVVSFMDETPSVEVDLVIGADGLKSITKRALFPDHEEDPYPPHYEGLVGVGGFIPSPAVKGPVEKSSMNFVTGGNGFFGYFFSGSDPSEPHRDSPYHISEPGDSLAWWSTYAVDECPNPRSIDKKAVTKQLRERHSSWKDPVIRQILQSLEVDSMYPTWTVPPLPTWERDGVVLVGDAAHALPSTSGQGSSQALEDVEAFTMFFSHYLRKQYEEEGRDGEATMKHKSVSKKAAKAYMSLRVPRVTAILEEAQRMQNNKRDKSWMEEHMMYAIMWIIGCFPSLMFGKLTAVANYNISEEVKKVLAQESS